MLLFVTIALIKQINKLYIYTIIIIAYAFIS